MVHSRTTRISVFAALTAAAGPAAAMLYETGHLRVFPEDMLHDLWLLVVIAGLAAGVGAGAFFKGARVIGAVCFLSNTIVVFLYGFIAAFFTLGGSR